MVFTADWSICDSSSCNTYSGITCAWSAELLLGCLALLLVLLWAMVKWEGLSNLEWFEQGNTGQRWWCQQWWLAISLKSIPYLSILIEKCIAEEIWYSHIVPVKTITCLLLGAMKALIFWQFGLLGGISSSPPDIIPCLMQSKWKALIHRSISWMLYVWVIKGGPSVVQLSWL